MNTDTLRNRRAKRTTVTLEADVADFFQETLRKNKNLKEKQLINKLLRAGIKNEFQEAKVNFKIKGFKSSLASGVTAGDLEKLLDEV